MPDMKTELMKLNNLKFDDAEDEPTMAVVDDATSERERVWNYIKANPMSSANDVAAALGVSAAHAASQIFALHNKAILARGLIGNVYHYQVVGDSYPRFDRQAHGKKVGAMLRGKPKMRKLKAKAQAAVNDKQVKMLEAEMPTGVASLPSGMRFQATVSQLLDTMSIVQARELYDELKKIFGG
jgi:hypothetical protein